MQFTKKNKPLLFLSYQNLFTKLKKTKQRGSGSAKVYFYFTQFYTKSNQVLLY